MAGLFIKLDCDYWDHPKVVQAGLMPAVLYLRMTGYCMQHTTNGFVPDGQMPRFAMPATSKLTAALSLVGLIEQVEGGWMVPGYVERYRTADEVAEIREKRAAAGRKGGRPRKQTESNLLSPGFHHEKANGNPEVEVEVEVEVEERESSDTSSGRAPGPDDDDLPRRIWTAAGIARPEPNDGDRASVARALRKGWQPDQLLAKAGRALTAEHDRLPYLRRVLTDCANTDPPTEHATATPTGETKDAAWAAVRRIAATGNHAWGPDCGLSPRARLAALRVRATIKGDREAEAKWAFFAAWDDLAEVPA